MLLLVLLLLTGLADLHTTVQGPFVMNSNKKVIMLPVQTLRSYAAAQGLFCMHRVFNSSN